MILHSQVRTYSNSLEAVFTVVALSKWPWHKKRLHSHDISAEQEDDTALIFAALAVIIRPTNLIIWVFVIAIHFSDLWGHESTKGTAIRFLRYHLLPAIVTAVAVQALLGTSSHVTSALQCDPTN